MLILPPFQRQGHGGWYCVSPQRTHTHTHTRPHTHTPHTYTHSSAQLLQSVYDVVTSDPQVLDVTVEDPSDEFTALRDFVDCKNALRLDCFQPPKVHEEFGTEMEVMCQQKLKLNKVRENILIPGRYQV